MSLFHIANDTKNITMVSLFTQYELVRAIENLPMEVLEELKQIFGCEDLSKPQWTKTGISLSHVSPLYLWYLYEKAEDKTQREEEPAVTTAMSRYAEAVFTSGSAYAEQAHNYGDPEVFL